MAEENQLTKEQQAFLEECNLEFSDRFTDSDLEYKKIYDAGIPSPPIMCPWNSNTRARFSNNWGDRGRSGGSSNNEGRNNDHRRDRDFRYNNSRERDYQERRYRPYN